MIRLGIFAAIALLIIIYLPSLWAKSVLTRNADHRPDITGTGGEFAVHLLGQLGLHSVAVETAQKGSHYSPTDKVVRLEPRYLDNYSVSAMAVAAHEVGHAIQDRDGYGPLKTRTRLVQSTKWIQKAGAAVAYTSPLLGLISQAPSVVFVAILVGVLSQGVAVVVNLVTLPVEFDASFNRALPILEHGGYLSKADLPAAKQVLRACALTYLASSLVSLLGFWRWIRLFR